MWLTRLRLSRKDKRVLRDTSDCYQMHRTVMSMFPDGSIRQARDEHAVLYRLETGDGMVDQLLIQSATKPDTSRLPGGYMLAGELPAVSCLDMTKVLARIKPGSTLRFKLRANPTKRANETSYEERKAGKKGSNGIRYPIRDDQQLIEWLARKGLQHGFEPLSVAFVETGEHRGLIADKKVVSIFREEAQSPVTNNVSGRRVVQFNSVTFEGYLKIIDLDLLKASIKSGIGTEKAFGFGLLSFAFT